MKYIKTLKIKSGSTIQKAVSMKDELGVSVEITNYSFYSQIRNVRGDLIASATFTFLNPYTGLLTYSANETKELINTGRLNDVAYMDIAIRPIDSDVVIHTETIKLEIDRGITEL